MTPVAELLAPEKIQEQPQVIEALALVTSAKAITVANLDDREYASEIGRKIAGIEKWFAGFVEPMKRAAAAAHKAICTQENSVINPLQEAKRHLSSQIGAFDQRMERERRAEEDRIRKQLAEEAEAAAKKQSQEQAITDAIALEAEGDSKGAAAVLNNPAPVSVYVPPVILPSVVPQTKGVAATTRYAFRVVNADLIPREYMVPDEKAIGQIVRALKEKTKIPGIEVYPEHGASFRG